MSMAVIWRYNHTVPHFIELYNFKEYITQRLNKCQRIPKGQSKMDNPEKHRTQKTKTNKAKTQHNMCWTPICVNKNK